MIHACLYDEIDVVPDIELCSKKKKSAIKKDDVMPTIAWNWALGTEPAYSHELFGATGLQGPIQAVA